MVIIRKKEKKKYPVINKDISGAFLQTKKVILIEKYEKKLSRYMRNFKISFV